MRTTKILILLFVVLAAAGLTARIVTRAKHVGHKTQEAAVYYCPMHPTYTSERPGDCPICNMRLVKREPQAPAQAQLQTEAAKTSKDICLTHDCPMVHDGKPCPMLVVAKEGESVTCPVCGTHVTQLAGGTAPPEGYSMIVLTPQKQQLIGVKTAVAARRLMTKTIRTVGRIAYDPELYQTEQEHIQAVKALGRAKARGVASAIENAQELVESSRMKLRLQGLSQELIDEMAGWEGPDKSLLLADRGGKAWLYAPIYEFELPLVKAGQTISAEIPSAPGKPLQGVIRAIDSVLDPQTRTARARAVLDNTEGLLRPEMFVNASITIALGDVLAIPQEAVFDTGTKRIVFVVKGDGMFEPRNVVAGTKADGYCEVKSGISAGETVVTNGNFLIDSESRLKAALEGMGAKEHQH